MVANLSVQYARRFNPTFAAVYKKYTVLADRYVSPTVRAVAEKIAYVVDDSMGFLGLAAVLYGLLRLIRAPSQTVSTIMGFALLGIGSRILEVWNQYPWDFLSRVMPSKQTHSLPERTAVAQLLKSSICCGQSPVLVGPPGCGKTTLVEELARVYPEREIYSLDYAKMNGAREDVFFLRFINMMNEAFLRGDKVTLFIDEVHQLSEKFRNAMKFWVHPGVVSVVAASTTAEYRKLSAEDDAFCRRLRKFEVPPPPSANSADIIAHRCSGLSRPVIDAITTQLNRPEYRALPAVALKFIENVRADGKIGSLTVENVPGLIEHYRADLVQPPRAATLDTLQAAVERLHEGRASIA